MSATVDNGYRMRKPCGSCGVQLGRIEEKGAQDCVYCLGCDRWQYNAPRVETGKSIRTVTTVHNGVRPKQRMRILVRANRRCELCGATPSDTAKLHVSHMLSVADGLTMGLDETVINSDENLLCLCDECNLGMGKQTIPLRLAASIVKARFDNTRIRERKGNA